MSHQTLRFQAKELGEIDMVPLPLATLDLVIQDNAQSALVGESERVLRHDSKPPSQPAGETCGDMALLPGTSGSAGNTAAVIRALG